MIVQGVLQTGQHACYGTNGTIIPCAGTGQDGEFRRGLAWPAPRFRIVHDTVVDNLTGLIWPVNANLAGFPLSWHEALDFVRNMNSRSVLGYSDWRLPDRGELRSLVSYQTRSPALPEAHPFEHVFLGWYWTLTTAAINRAYAWYVHLDGARMFYGHKDQYYLVWPVRGNSAVLRRQASQAAAEEFADCTAAGTCRSEELRFELAGEVVSDRFTGLQWMRRASLSDNVVSWSEALELVADLNASLPAGAEPWRLPNINELESLVDTACHTPALPPDHPFVDVREVYWSSTTSHYEPDWAWALYLVKGALGVGVKMNRNFHAWPVRSG